MNFLAGLPRDSKTGRLLADSESTGYLGMIQRAEDELVATGRPRDSWQLLLPVNIECEYPQVRRTEKANTVLLGGKTTKDPTAHKAWLFANLAAFSHSFLEISDPEQRMRIKCAIEKILSAYVNTFEAQKRNARQPRAKRSVAPMLIMTAVEELRKQGALINPATVRTMMKNNKTHILPLVNLKFPDIEIDDYVFQQDGSLEPEPWPTITAATFNRLVSQAKNNRLKTK